MKEIIDEAVKCPYCGTTLLSRYTMHQHLTLKVCQGADGDIIKLDNQKDNLWKYKKTSKDKSNK